MNQQANIEAEIFEQWYRFLRACLDDFRMRWPEDTRTDEQLAEALMEHFVERGLLEKQDGKYKIPRIQGDPTLWMAAAGFDRIN